MNDTEKSARRRAKARAEQGAERINIELRGVDAKRWRDTRDKLGGATHALRYLLAIASKKTVTTEEALAVIASKLKPKGKK